MGVTQAEKIAIAKAIKEKARRELLPFILWTKPDYKAGWFHHAVCEKLGQFLQDVLDEKSPRLMLQAPPRHGKSEIVSRRFPAYAFGRNPDLSMIATSYSNDLASAMNRDVQRVIDSEEYGQLFPDTTLSGAAVRTVTAKGAYLRNSDNFEIVNHRGGYKSAGVGTGVTGRGGRILLIDDPVKDAQEAYSQTTRDSVWDWYTSTLYTRCEPGGGILLIMCMVGGTPVLMADGTEKPLRDIRPGDEIATYKDGALSTSFVKHWINQGSDFCYEIRTISGRVVKANERHPFLVRRNGELEWVRLKNLVVGDKIVSARAPGKALSAPSTDATSQSVARDSASLTTTRLAGQTECDHLPSILSHEGSLDFATGTGLNLSSTTPYSNNREESAPCADSLPQARTLAPTGTTSSALTTTTEPGRTGACSATTATLPLAMGRLLKSSPPPLSTYELIEDEIESITTSDAEDVFDIEVAETENFIANGLISHNTRWHEDDLAGRILKQMERGGEQWEVVRFPAVAEEDELYRLKGEALHPERYPIKMLDNIRLGTSDEAGVGSRVWASLYQQRPSASEGVIFRREHWQYFNPINPLKIEGDIGSGRYLRTHLELRAIIQAWDTAAGGKQSNDYSCCVTLGISRNRYYVLDVWKQKVEFPELKRAVRQQYDKWKPNKVCVEGGGSATGKSVIQELSRDTRIPFFELVHVTDKVLRANVVSPTHEAGLVSLPDGAPWAHDFVESCAVFPNAANDDDVDAFIMALETAVQGRKPMQINDSFLRQLGA